MPRTAMNACSGCAGRWTNWWWSGIETTIPLFQKLVREPDIINGEYSIHWLEKYLASAKP